MADDFGVDDELRSNEELYSGTFSQLMNISCAVVADEEQSQSASLFEAACAEKIQQFDDSESDEEVHDVHLHCIYRVCVLIFSFIGPFTCDKILFLGSTDVCVCTSHLTAHVTMPQIDSNFVHS